MKHLFERPMDSQTERRLRCLLKLENDPDPLPEEVIASYWRYKVMHDKIGGLISADGVISILERSKTHIPMPIPPGFVQELRDGLYPKGTKIEVIWRGGSYRECIFMLATPREIQVEMDGELKKLPLDKDMRLVREEELTLAKD